MGSSGRRYGKEFRLGAARLVTDRGYTLVTASQELGVSTWSLRSWIKQLRKSGELQVDGQTETLVEEVKRLRHENQRLRMEKEILKKAAQYFARESP